MLLCCRYKEAVNVAELQNHPEAKNLKRRHFEWLVETGQARDSYIVISCDRIDHCDNKKKMLSFQEEEAGKILEAEGDVAGAIKLFLKGGFPGYAADCVNNHPSHQFPVSVSAGCKILIPDKSLTSMHCMQDNTMETVASALLRFNMFEKVSSIAPIAPDQLMLDDRSCVPCTRQAIFSRGWGNMNGLKRRIRGAMLIGEPSTSPVEFFPAKWLLWKKSGAIGWSPNIRSLCPPLSQTLHLTQRNLNEH